MLCVRELSQGKEFHIYIDSIKQKFNPKPSKQYIQRLRTTPNTPSRLAISPNIDRLLRKISTIPSRKSAPRPPSPSPDTSAHLHLDSIPEEALKKRWSQIQKEQYNAIRHQISVSQGNSPSKKQIPSHHRYAQPLAPIKQQDALDQLLKNKASSGHSWIEHIRTINQEKHHRQSILKTNGGYLFPELLSKISIFNTIEQEENEALIRSIEISDSQAENIFCSRRVKKNQLKLRGQKVGEQLIKRRKVQTINYSNFSDSIAPWSRPAPHSHSILY